MADGDLLEMYEEATQEALAHILKTTRDIRAESVNRPAIGVKRTLEERKATERQFLSDPMNIAARYDELSAQFQLRPNKPIPRRLVDYAILAGKELGEEQDNAG